MKLHSVLLMAVKTLLTGAQLVTAHQSKIKDHAVLAGLSPPLVPSKV